MFYDLARAPAFICLDINLRPVERKNRVRTRRSAENETNFDSRKGFARSLPSAALVKRPLNYACARMKDVRDMRAYFRPEQPIAFSETTPRCKFRHRAGPIEMSKMPTARKGKRYMFTRIATKTNTNI